jgi:hypothetical protein
MNGRFKTISEAIDYINEFGPWGKCTKVAEKMEYDQSSISKILKKKIKRPPAHILKELIKITDQNYRQIN